MKKQKIQRPAMPLLVAALLTLVAACGKPAAFRTPVGKFREASVVVIQTTKIYLTQLNKVERDEYLYSQAGKPDQIRLIDVEQRQVFSKEGIAARLKALDQLSNYVDLLDKLAKSDQPDKIKAKAADLQTSVTGLSGQIATLSGEDDKAFKAAAGKVFPIIGEILQVFVEQKIEKALAKAVEAGSDPVNTLISAIEVDARLAYERKRNAYSAARVALVDQYNREFLRGRDASPEKLKAYADAISAGEDKWEAFLSAQPNDGLAAMRTANDALVKFARTPKPNIVDFKTLVDAMESFAATADRVGKAVQTFLK